MSPGEPLLSATGLKKHFDQSDGLLDRMLGGGSTVKAVDGVDLEIEAGETLAVVGESGCGKSTLGQTLLNLHRATDGSVKFRGKELTGLSDGEMRPYRRHLQMVFQDPLASLNPRQTVGDIVTAPMEVHDLPQSDSDTETTADVTVEGDFDVTVDVDEDVDRVIGTRDDIATVGITVRKSAGEVDGYDAVVEDEAFVGALSANVVSAGEPVRVSVSVTGDDAAVRLARTKVLLDRVGLEPTHVDRYPGQFSGGQQQRVGIARALAVEPELIVADEPVSALDVSVQAQILELLDELQDELDLSLLFITHDLSVVRQVADRVAVMYLGEIVETGPVRKLFDEPRHPYTKSLLSAVPRINPAAREDRVVLEGTVPSPIDPPSGCRFHTRCPAVIPGEGWSGDQPAFRRAFTLRNRVEAGELDPDAVRKRLVTEGSDPDEEAVAQRLVDGALPGEIESLPAAARDAIHEAAVQVVNGDDEAAVATVREAFPSPCAAAAPTTLDLGDHRTAACHRVDPGYDATEF